MRLARFRGEGHGERTRGFRLIALSKVQSALFPSALIQLAHPRSRVPTPTSRHTTAFDVSDLLFYLQHHSSVSGIQRVVAELLPVMVESRDNCVLTAFDAGDKRFVVVPRERMLNLLVALHGLADSEAARGRISDEARHLRGQIGSWPSLTVTAGDVVLLLGAAWSFEGFFAEIQIMKRRGVRLVVLVYDLIPIITAGFPRATADVFTEYITAIAVLADRVPAISQASRDSFATFCRANHWPVPEGAATGLPPGLRPDAYPAETIDPAPAWPRPFVLFVGTVEGRKNHLLALRAWQKLADRLDPKDVPDLVCVGRVGWNAEDFLRELTESASVGGKIHILAYGVPDRELYRLYRDCEFTVYPSRCEGWGLPVSEAFAFGKPVVTTRTSSLPEVGKSSAIYVDVDDADLLADTVEQLATDLDYRKKIIDGIDPADQLTWSSVGDAIWEEVDAASAIEHVTDPVLITGVEYGMALLPAYAGGFDGMEYLDFVNSSRTLPITGQVASPVRRAMARLVTREGGGHYNQNGLRIEAGTTVTIRFQRSVGGPGSLVIGTFAISGKFKAVVTHGSSVTTISQTCGSPIDVTLSDAAADAVQEVSIRLERVQNVRRALTLTSLLIRGDRTDISRNDSGDSKSYVGGVHTTGKEILYPEIAITSFESSKQYKMARFSWRAQRKIQRVIKQRRR